VSLVNADLVDDMVLLTAACAPASSELALGISDPVPTKVLERGAREDLRYLRLIGESRSRKSQ
jgi:hypothetical protein